MIPARDVLLLDGATGTELGRRGVDISLPMWSARAMLDAPDTLEAVHREYLEAGADLITADTFRTHRRSLAKAGLGERARELTARAVEIALRARDAVNPRAKVVGSVAPLEDCYRPDLAPPLAECEIEHREIMQHLLDAGVDGLLIETQNCLREASAAARAAIDVVQPQPGGRFWMISFCTRSDGPPNMLLSGESLTDLLPSLHGAFAIGVNCVAASAVEAQVKLLRLLVAPDIRLAAYANVGKATPAGEWLCTDAVDPEIYAQYAARWIDAGASVIGGCCGTRPDTIRALAHHLGKRA
jgi:S-methylmethionine-dependent homocysteine/selenocysteine methylase